MRIGIGYDSHRFAEGRRLILGGVEIPFDRGLSGHSDADVIAHAVADAILGAAGIGDIGSLFPPSDERWRDANSIELLRSAMRRVHDAGYRVVSADVTVVCEEPRIGPHVAAMRERLCGALGVSADTLSVKGKTNEGMGWIGRGEGIAAIAVTLLEPLPTSAE